MKKTLITLLALAGVAAAADNPAESYTSVIDIDITAAPANSTYASDFGLELQSPISVVTSTTNDLANWNNTGKPGTYNDGDLRPEVNVGDGGSWTLTFSLQNSGNEAITLQGIQLDMFTFNSNGWSQPGGTPRYFDFKIVANDTTTLFDSIDTDLAKSPYVIDGSGENNTSTAKSDTTFKIAFSDGYVLNAGETTKFSLTVSDGDNRDKTGTYIGLSSMSMLVPEPTTATLSLLALAGLAARRRRR